VNPPKGKKRQGCVYHLDLTNPIMLLARTRTQQQQHKLAVFVSFLFFSSLLLGLSKSGSHVHTTQKFGS